MRKPLAKLLAAGAATFAVCALWAAPAMAEFGFEDLDVTFHNADGTLATQAGSHPYSMTTTFDFNKIAEPLRGEVVDGGVKDLTGLQMPGLIGTPGATPTCSTADFLKLVEYNPSEGLFPSCADSTAVGKTVVSVALGGKFAPLPTTPVYNLQAPPGVAQKLGFFVKEVPVTVELTVNPDPPHNVIARASNVSTVLQFSGASFTLWGDPADPAHDTERGHCVDPAVDTCPANIPNEPYLTLPRACAGPLSTSWEADSWQHPGAWAAKSTVTHDTAAPPNPQGMSGCGKLGFSPSITAQPTTRAANSPTGLDFSLNVQDEGLTNPKEGASAQSDIEKAVVKLPQGFSINPSIAEGLAVCGEADVARETATSEAGAGCPSASKIGTVEVETPLLEETVDGALYQAAPYENPFGSLIALYVVLKSPTLGISIVQPLNVIPDPVTGQLTTVAEEMPQLPFSHFRLHFREGARSPLASPPACGTYSATATLYPYSGGQPVTTASAFQIVSGPESQPCPSGGVPPFHPGLIAGTLNNAAGHYSPFNVRLFRSDSEQEITHFSIKLPPGIVGKLAGIPFCPDAAIAAAKARTGPHGGQEEIESPSCPKASEIGHTLVGAGVGSSLAYAPGKVYLSGPYHGSPLSLVAITAGRVGPFDIGAVVVREAFKINPETAEVFVDSTGSDPIPHIIKGVPVHLRDIRVYTDRPEFVLNPTSCARTSTASTLLGSGLDFGSEADDQPVTVSTPFQAADCAALPYKPKLKLSLLGGARRNAKPALKAELTAKPGEAASKKIVVTLPHSEFLEQAHIKTVCTRVQFRAEACPAGSIYGSARATTPILDEPLEGPLYLRTSEHSLPDLVAHLVNKEVTFDAVGRIDSIKSGGIRTSFEAVPDAPITKVTIEMQGGNKGLLVNSTDLCGRPHRANIEMTAQSGKRHNTTPALAVKCPKKGKGKNAKRHQTRHRRHGARPLVAIDW